MDKWELKARLLENPQLLATLSETQLKDLLRQEDLFQSLFEILISHNNSDIAASAKHHVQLSEEINQKCELIATVLIKITQLQWENQEFYLKLIPSLYELVPDIILSKIEVRSALAESADTPVNILQKLADDTDNLVRYHLVRNPNTPIEVLHKLANDVDKSIQQQLLNSPNFPIDSKEEIAMKMAQDPDKWVRRKIAGNKNASSKVLQMLAYDKLKWIRLEVAQNPNTPATALEYLATDEDNEICRAVAFNHNTPVKVMEILATHENVEVRQAVTPNPNTPVALLEQLATDENFDVYWHVLFNPKTPVSLLFEAFANHKQDDGVRYALASNPSTPTTILDELANDENECSVILEEIAYNPNTSVATLEELATNEEICFNVRQYAIFHDKLVSISLLEQLATHEDWEIRRAVAANPNIPETLFQQLANDEVEQVRSHALARRVSHSQDIIKVPNTLEEKIKIFKSFADGEKPSLNRLTVLLSDYADESLLEKNFASSSCLERYAIAKNKKTPYRVLESLVKDSNLIVRAAAKANQKSR